MRSLDTNVKIQIGHIIVNLRRPGDPKMIICKINQMHETWFSNSIVSQKVHTDAFFLKFSETVAT